MPAPHSHPRPHNDPPFLHVLYDNSHLPFSPSVPSSAILAFLAQNNPWQHHPQSHLFPSNPYPSPPLPPPIAHKVWILDCKSCNTFLTNRGMKAVLLLRPNVSLYSSDALPVNCSAYTSNPDALRPRASCRPPSASHIPHRTCECLTQTLCCHGCGAIVGYMIVIPCARCTSSTTATNRATNGHRFVFHSSEVVGTERHYILDEPGVIPCEPTVVVFPGGPNVPPYAHSPAYSNHMDPHPTYHDAQAYFPSRSPSPALVSDYLPTPPLELADPILASNTTIAPDPFAPPRGHNYHSFQSDPSPYAPSPPAYRNLPHPHPRSTPISVASQSVHHLTNRSSSAASSPSSNSSPPPVIHPSSSPVGAPTEQKEQPLPHKLKSGDILFWHHLARNGEIPGVEDDKRARGDKLLATAGEKPSVSMLFHR